MNSSSREISFLLSDVSNPENYSKLIQLVYGELRRMAGHYFKRERPDHTLQPTALVHELYLRLLQHGPARYKNRGHFFGIAARVMRRILVEQARQRHSQRRGGGYDCVPLDEMQIPGVPAPDYLALEELLDRLKQFDERSCRIVELHVFGGLTSEEIASVLEMGESTVRRDWTHARIWLEKELQRPLQ